LAVNAVDLNRNIPRAQPVASRLDRRCFENFNGFGREIAEGGDERIRGGRVSDCLAVPAQSYQRGGYFLLGLASYLRSRICGEELVEQAYTRLFASESAGDYATIEKSLGSYPTRLL
jgi:hypothetical protein